MKRTHSRTISACRLPSNPVWGVGLSDLAGGAATAVGGRRRSPG